WVALAGQPIEENTVSWMTIEPGNPRPKPGQGEPAIPPECIAEGGADAIDVRVGEQSAKETVGAQALFGKLRGLRPGTTATLSSKDDQIDVVTGQSRNTGKPPAEAEAKPEASKNMDTEFLGADAFFSNSPGGRATMAIALGRTRN